MKIEFELEDSFVETVMLAFSLADKEELAEFIELNAVLSLRDLADRTLSMWHSFDALEKTGKANVSHEDYAYLSKVRKSAVLPALYCVLGHVEIKYEERVKQLEAKQESNARNYIEKGASNE